jgi:hypothetical protein
VSVEELCREAGASKMTFYKYFANKAELIRDESWNKVPMEFDRFQQQLRNLLYFGLLTREEENK